MGILSGTVIAVTGTLEHEPSQIKKWVHANGGAWSPRVDQHVTHLIASRPAWKTVTDPVLKAAELNIHIVTYEWLEDSLQRKRRLAEKQYTWDKIKEDKKRRKELKKVGKLTDSKKFEDGCKKITELTGSGTFKKLPTARKPKPSKSHFFGTTINTKFVSAQDALHQRRAAREAAEAENKAAKAAKKPSASGSAQAPITIDDGSPDPVAKGSLLTPPPSASSIKAALQYCPSPPTSSQSPANATAAMTGARAKKPSLKDLYHYYLDSTGFQYKIILVRRNISTNQITRYQLSILESHTQPHTYCTLVQYTPPDQAKTEINDASDANIRNPLLAFLRPGATPQNPTLPSPDEQARLRSFVTPASPASAQPFKALICPMNSPFASAWRAFRHTFRSLTLLSWEERFDITPYKAIQTARAVALNIEPYIYSKPELGLPVGLSVQEAGLYQGSRYNLSEMTIIGDAEDGYIRNEYKLPGMNDQELSMNGVIGSAIWREEEKARKAELEKKEREEERIRKEKEKAKAAKRMFHDGPMFNGPTGKPGQEEKPGWKPVVQRKEGAAVFTTFGKKSKPWYTEKY
jgi:hypothetical protein